MEGNIVLMTRHIRNLHGFSHPFLAEGNDGRWYVVKLCSDQTGANLLFNESAGSELYRACGLAVPVWKPVRVTDKFLDDNLESWPMSSNGRQRPKAGLAFGSRFLGEEGVPLLEILPGTYFSRVTNATSFWLAWLIDICAHHADNRQVIFQESKDRRLRAVFVDHGHVFGGPAGGARPNFMVSSYLDTRIYQHASFHDVAGFFSTIKTLDVDRLWQQVNVIPEEWKTTSALRVFADCLNRLEDAKLLQGIADKMTDALSRGTNGEPTDHHTKRGAAPEVLRFGIPGTEPGANPVNGALCSRAYNPR